MHDEEGLEGQIRSPIGCDIQFYSRKGCFPPPEGILFIVLKGRRVW